ncbi:MAG TPA: hypothetical protein VHC70_07380 [Phycisphaerales bacterium]|jgi:hypothetical protein|nr:hypothetical protein [Phycisphaerales bacterium]
MSATPSTICIKCGGRMEFGIVVDYSRSGERPQEWVRGLPKRSWLDGRLKAPPRDRLQVASLRCRHCGYLELYAPEPSVCVKCKYDRRGLPPGTPCPECGTLPPAFAGRAD